MKSIRALYFDGRSSASNRVKLEIDASTLRILGDGIDKSWHLQSLKISPRIGDIHRSIRFPDGSLCELEDDRSLDLIFSSRSNRDIHRFIDGWERSSAMALLALLLTLAAIGGFIKYGVPAIAGHVARVVPPSTETALGLESLAFLDKYLMKPTALSSEKQSEVRSVFAELKAGLPYAGGYRIEMRNSGKVGANAFALPGGTIVVTDAMVELADAREELIGVLAHEAAHQRSRHALRQVLQSTGTGLLIAAVSGDVTSITSLSATIPSALISAGYSREFEYEADDAAVEYLKKAGIQPKIYADTLARLQAEHDKKSDVKKEIRRWSPMELFSTHPETSERIKRVLGGR